MEAETFIDKIKPPRLEDAGLEDCALPPESIKEAFLKAASAVRSFASASDDEDESECLDDPWEYPSDKLVGITEGVTDVSGDDVLVIGGDDEGVGPCVDGLQGLEIGGNSKGILGNEDEGDEEDGPILAEGCMFDRV